MSPAERPVLTPPAGAPRANPAAPVPPGNPTATTAPPDPAVAAPPPHPAVVVPSAGLAAVPPPVSLAATGRLADFAAAGLIGPVEIQLARHLAHLHGETDELVTLAIALAVAALQAGSVGLDLARAEAILPVLSVADPPSEPAGAGDGDQPPTAAGPPWPAPAEWAAALAVSPLVTVGDGGPAPRPLRLVGGLLYLERSWADQERVAAAVRCRLDAAVRTPAWTVDCERYFDRAGLAPDEPDRQRQAARLALSRRLTVIGGGPGTGKTTTVAKVLATVAAAAGRPPRIALAAPTGKAAARLDAAVRGNLVDLGADALAAAIAPAATIHRLLGIKPWGAVDHGPDHPLAADVVVVDEVSMLSLRHMRLLLDAVPEAAHLILVGDPDQLASVESGAVLGDLVAALTTADDGPEASTAPADGFAAPTASDGVLLPTVASDASDGGAGAPFVRLQHNYRFDGAIGDLAEAIRTGSAERVLALLEAAPEGVEFAAVDSGEAQSPAALAGFREAVVAAGAAVMAAIAAGDWAGAAAAVDRHRVLCAHRHGPYGVARWQRVVEAWLAAALSGYGRGGPWYPGLPVQVTHNDEVLGVFNGDTGVIVPAAGRPRAALATAGGLRLIGPAELGGLEAIHATTIHKAQGSQYGAVSVIVPPPGAALLTRELLYTAVTRAERRVRLIGTPESVAHAVERRALRASGLAERLRRC